MMMKKVFCLALLSVGALFGAPLPSVSDMRVAPLLQTRWCQQDAANLGTGKPCFNYHTPGNMPCGCVATAGAQIMRYFSWPTDAVSPRTFDYFINGVLVSGTQFGGVYDWSQMPLIPSAGVTAAQREMLGRLTFDVAIACCADFGKDFTDARGYMLAPLLTGQYGYSNAMSAMFGSGVLGENQLKDVLIPNLDANLPVVVHLDGMYGGHDAIVDGYGYDGGALYLHYNLGWGGVDDGWYRPFDMECPLSGYCFDDIFGVVCNIFPTDGTDKALCSGRVLSSIDGTPVVGATVSAGGESTVTGENGIYALRLPPSGSYTLQASINGAVGTREVTLPSNIATPVYPDGTYSPWPAPQVANRCEQDILLDAEGSYVAIQFDLVGGTGESSHFYPKGAAVGTLPVPTRAGFWFDGWYTAAKGGSRIDESYVPQGPVTLYAQWAAVKPQDAGVWTTNVADVKSTAGSHGGLILVLFANVAECGWSQYLQPILESSQFLNWAHANNVYLLTTDASHLPLGCKSATDAYNYFVSLYMAKFGVGYYTLSWPTIAVVKARDVDSAVSFDVARNDGSSKVGGIPFGGTVESLIEGLSTYLDAPPIPTPEPVPPKPVPPAPDVPDTDQSSLYASPTSMSFEGNATYTGWVRNSAGEIAGLLTIKAAKAAKPEKGGRSKLTIQYTPFGGKKQTIKLDPSEMPVAGGNPTVDIPGLGTVTLGGRSLSGAGLQAGKDLLKSKDKAEKSAANACLASKNGTWTFALKTTEGCAAFSVMVKKGKGKLAGTLPDGTKVSVSSQGVLGDKALAIPFTYAKKGSVGFVFWVNDDGSMELSDMTALKLADGRTLETTLVAPSAAHRLADGTCTLTTPFFTQTFTVAGKKWTFPKQQKKLGADDPNPYGAKMTFTEKTGVVKGSFTMLDSAGNKLKYTVNGIVVDGKMYGSAFLKDVGSVLVSAK